MFLFGMDNIVLRFTFAQRIIILLISLFIFSLIGSVFVALLTRNGITTESLRLATIVQDCVIFIAPAIATAVLISVLPAGFLCINSGFRFPMFLLALTALIVSMPVMNLIVNLNEQLSLPEALSGLEEWMRQAETKAQDSVKILLGTSSVLSLVINLLIVGVLAGVSEEIFFRGALQRVLATSSINHHCAIWLSALIFSAFHLQFFGFFPRLLLGAYFGYLLYWSKSLWLPIIAHTLNNSLVVFTMWLGEVKGDKTMEAIDNWGMDSPTLILASIIMTFFTLRYMYRYRRV